MHRYRCSTAKPGKYPIVIGYLRADVRVFPAGVLPFFSRLKIVWGSRGTAEGAGGLLGAGGGRLLVLR